MRQRYRAERGDGFQVRHKPSITIKLQKNSMKKIKMKDTILSHYQKVHELEMDGYTVRVFKPRTMQQLPAYKMLAWIKGKAKDAILYMETENKAEWQFGNPDYGLWDALTICHYTPRFKLFDIYITSILVRPYSREAYETYSRQQEMIDDMNHRLMLMWDSREFDRVHGYDNVAQCPSVMAELGKMYQVDSEQDDIEDLSPDFYHGDDDAGVGRRCVKIGVKDDQIVYNAVIEKDELMKDGGTPLMHDCAKVFYDFRKKHPDVTEIHFYTDEILSIEDDDEEEGE